MTLSHVKRKRIASFPFHPHSPAFTDAAGDVLQVPGYDPYGRDIINANIEGAPDYEEVTGTVDGSESYQARDTVTVSAALTGSADLSLAAGVKIVFEPGFSVAAGGELHASIDFNLINTAEVETKYLYTDQEREGNGLYYYGARYYDPDLGRFLAADTVLDGLNRYAYCGNNPVNYVDPTGHSDAVLEHALEIGEIPEEYTEHSDYWKEEKEREWVRKKVEELLGIVNLSPEDCYGGMWILDSLNQKMYFGFWEDGEIFFYICDATNNISPRQPGTDDPIADGTAPHPYYPQEFPSSPPEGWKITGYVDAAEPLQGPKFTTDAKRETLAYIDGKPADEPQIETGFNIHGSDGNENTKGDNNINDPTYGCIRQRNRDIRALGQHFKNIEDHGGTVRLHVY